MQVKDLKAFPRNPRKITPKKLDMLGKAMREFGDLSGVVFNCRTGHLVGGHQRIKHLDPSWGIEGGFIKTPWGDFVYREVDWDEKKEMAANIAANKHSGEWDFPILKDIFVEIDTGAIDIELTGFEEMELKDIFDYEKKPDNGDGLIPPKDPNIIARISFHPGLWLGKREEILKIFERMEKTYECKVKIEE